MVNWWDWKFNTILIAGCLWSCNGMEKNTATTNAAPVAEKIPHTLTYHNRIFTDDYYWLRNRNDKKVKDYLEAENAFTKQYFDEHKTTYDKVLKELKSRVLKDDESVPYFDNGYYYVSKYEGDNEHALYYRMTSLTTDQKELLLDVNVLARDKPFCEEALLEVSPDNKLLAYTIDFVGRRKYELHFLDITTGKPLKDVIKNTAGTVVWANDNRTVFYTLEDEETLRSHKIMKHVLGSDPEQDVCVYEEKDEMFNVDVNRSKSGNYIFIHTASTNTTECLYIPSNQPQAGFKVFAPRKTGHEYAVDEHHNTFYIRSNLNALNYKICTAQPGATSLDQWTDLVQHEASTWIGDFELTKDFLVVEVRVKGLVKLMILDLKPKNAPKPATYIEVNEEDYIMSFSVNEDPQSNVLRYYYSSLKTPTCEYDYDLTTHQKTLLKQQKLNVPYHPEEYTTKRVFAKATDGTEIPISMVYKKDLFQKGSNPCLVYGYGSYGVVIDPYFSASRLSLLDRGFVFCIAHIRGGEDMGRHWYDDGRLLHKKNTFTDFIACSSFLVEEGYSHPQKLTAQGGSAGGLLMGAVLNMQPHLYRAVVAEVPFVDVINTMMDKEIPLTTGEYEEWGNPNEKQYFDYMLSYSPYDNVKKQAYPALLVTTGLHDSQVQYWEPAKWVAKLRTCNTGTKPLLLHTNMAAGHGGASGRFEGLKEIAMNYTFLLSNL